MKLNKWISIIVVIVALLVTAKFALATAPTASDGEIVTLEDTTYTFAAADFSFADGEDDTDTFATLKITSLPAKGKLKVSGVDVTLNQEVNVSGTGFAGTLTFVPTANENGNDYASFGFTVIDSADEESTANTMTFDVTPVNDAPVVNSIAGDTSLFEGEAFTWTVSASDVESNTVAIDTTASTVDGKSLSTVSGLTVTGFDIKWTTPESGEAKNYVFSIVVKETTTIPALSSAAKDQTLSVKPYFAIKSLEINGKSSGDLSLEETNEITIEVRNDFTEDLENVAITATLKDVGDDDDPEEADEFDLDNGKSEEVTLEFTLDSEDVEEDSYELEIRVEGEDEDGNMYTTIFTKTVDVERPRHRVIVSRVVANPETLLCSFQQTSLQVSVENIGKSDEDNVEIRVRNAALKIDERKSNIELDKFSERDNDARATFDLSVKGAAAGDYELSVETYRDGDLDDSQKVAITVEGCAAAPVEQKEEGLPITDEYIQQLREKLEKSLVEQSQQPLQPLRTVEGFRQSDTYVALLAVLTVLLLIAVLLGLVTMVVKKR